MKQILQTSRLLLRELNTDDAVRFYELNSNPTVIQYTGDEPFESIETAKQFLHNYSDYDINGYGRWAVIEKTSGVFLGWCGLKYSKTSDETDIGFRFFESYWNKGFATESAIACLHYGFQELGLKTIVGRAMAANIASIKVLEKIGLAYEKEFDFNWQKGLVFRIENSL